MYKKNIIILLFLSYFNGLFAMEDPFALHKAVLAKDSLGVREFLINEGYSVDLEDSAGYKPIHYAAQGGSVDVCIRLIGFGASLDDYTNEEEEKTPLHLAAGCGEKDVVELLVEHGAGIVARNHAGDTPKMCARRTVQNGPKIFMLSRRKRRCRKIYNYLQTVEDCFDAVQTGNLNRLRSFAQGTVLRAIRGRFGDQLLHTAIEHRDKNIVNFLLQYTNVNGRKKENDNTPLITATEACDCRAGEDIVQMLIQYGAFLEAFNNVGQRPLHCAAKRGNLSLIQSYLSKDADKEALDVGRCRPLHHAIESGSLPAVGMLLNADVDVNAAAHNGDQFSLDYAKGKAAILYILLRAGVNKLALKSDGSTPFHDSVTDLDTLNVYLQQIGPDIDEVDGNGNTLLHRACSYSEQDESARTRLIINHGANLNARALCGKTPLHMAVAAQKMGDILLLVQEGAETNILDGEGKYPEAYATGPQQDKIMRYFRILRTPQRIRSLEQENVECPICSIPTKKLDKSQYVALLCCNGFMCRRDFAKLKAKNAECPLCRGVLE